MDSMQPKKLIIINILDILKKYTDEDHRLNQKEIAEKLEKDYGMKVDRKAIKRNLMNLIDFGFEIEYSKSIRMIEIKNEKGKMGYFRIDCSYKYNCLCELVFHKQR